jgi:beta-galactosidase beta subunit
MKSQDEAKLEVHQKFIDIQIPVTKSETFGWRSLNTLKKSSGGYAAEKDIEFFDDKPITYIPVQPANLPFLSRRWTRAVSRQRKNKKNNFKVAI